MRESECKAHKLGKEENGELVICLEFFIDAALIGVKVGLAQRTDRNNAFSAIAHSRFEELVSKVEGNIFLGNNEGASAAASL